MGKAKKEAKTKDYRNDPLGDQIVESATAKPSTRVKQRIRQEEDEFVDNKLSQRIIQQAREQQEELENEFLPGQEHEKRRFQEVSLGTSSMESEEEDEILDTFIEPLADIEISEDDENALALFLKEDTFSGIAEIIKEKITEKETEINTQFSDTGSVLPPEFQKLVPTFQEVGKVLSRYRSGKLPKAFKAIPKMTFWEEVLEITKPEEWSSAAMYQATRIFASNLKDSMAQRFYCRILYPRLRDEIQECKKLNFHLYEALKKAAFKPGAFYKGIILPLCESGTCTEKEAAIFGSAIAKFSIPKEHSSVAIIKIAEMDYTHSNSIILRTLLEKKYGLAYRVIDAVVAHFLRFALSKNESPVKWHQCLLTFAQCYKNEISSEQQDSLLSLLTVHSHPQITPEIRRELQSAKVRC